MVKKLVNSAIFAGMATVIVFPPQAFAYLDPGTGSYVLQVAAALFFGGVFVVKTFWEKIMGFFSSIFGGKGKKHLDEHHDKHK
jgi:hypothetical protein